MKASRVNAVGQTDDGLGATQRVKLQLRARINRIPYCAATADRNDLCAPFVRAAGLAQRLAGGMTRVLQLHALEAFAQLAERARQVADETCARSGRGQE